MRRGKRPEKGPLFIGALTPKERRWVRREMRRRRGRGRRRLALLGLLAYLYYRWRREP